MDMTKGMQESRVWHCDNMTGGEVGCLLALSLLRCEKNVTVATFKEAGIHIVNLDKNSTFRTAYRNLQRMPNGIINLNKPMLWASQHNKEYDVFINVIDQIAPRNKDAAEEGIAAYGTKMNLPNARYVSN